MDADTRKFLEEFVSAFSRDNQGWDYPMLIRLRDRAQAMLKRR